MNKQRGIIIGVLALIVTMMVGYALFSETITINGTATAKGDFGISTTCIPGFDEKTLEFYTNQGLVEEFKTQYKSQGYENDSCTVSGNTVNFSTNLLYPGAQRLYSLKVTNTGSIDTVIKPLQGTIELCVNNEDGTKKCYNETCNEGTCSGNIPGYGESSMYIGTVQHFPLKSDGSVPATEEELNSFYNADGNVVLKSGESLYFVLMASLSDDLDKVPSVIGTNNKYDLKVTSTMNIPVEQVTAN